MRTFGESAGLDLLADCECVDLTDLNSLQIKFFRGDLNAIAPSKDQNGRKKFEDTVNTTKTALCAKLEAHGFKNMSVEKIITEQERYNKLSNQYGNRGIRPGKIDTGEEYTRKGGEPFTVVSPKFAKALANGDRNVLRITSMYFYIKLDDAGKSKLRNEMNSFSKEMKEYCTTNNIEITENHNWTKTYVEAKKMSPGDFIENYGGTVVICFDYTHKHNRPLDGNGNELIPVKLDDWATEIKNRLFSTPAILFGYNNPNKTATANFNNYNFKLGPQDIAKNELVTDNGKLRIQGAIN
ncbi:MAG: hypothetical protein WC449_02760 [Candidatus Paceibacterota bacterium]